MDATGNELPRSVGLKKKYILTIAVYVCFFVFGFASSMIGPARLDVGELLHEDFNHVAYGQVSRSVGYSLGALLTAWLFDRMNRQLGLVLSLIASGASMIVVPFLSQLWVYLSSELVYGFFNAGIDVGTNSWILEIWQDSANPYMQGMHFSFALGMTFAPLVVEPFLSPQSNSTNATKENYLNGIFIANGAGDRDEGTRIVIPYSIGSFSMIAAGIMLLVLYFKVPYTELKRKAGGKEISGAYNSNSNQNNDDSINNNTDSIGYMDGNRSLMPLDDSEDGKKEYLISIIILASLLLCFYTGIELSTINFLPEFLVVIDLHLSKSKAAFITSVASAAFAIQRLISIAIATKLRPKTMLYVSFVMIMTGNLILLFFANHSETFLWTACMILGSGHACIYPCIMSFLEERINVTTGVCGIFMLSSCLSSIMIPIVIGNFIESYPLVYVLLNLSGLTACLVIFSCLYVVDRKFRRKQRALHTVI